MLWYDRLTEEIALKSKDFCCVDDFSVIIPYRKLEVMLDSANKIAEIQELCRRMDEKYSALKFMYSELLEKVAEINRYL